MAVTAATASGEPDAVVHPDRWRHSLILVVTRRCNLRCAYCPTVKDGLPDLTVDDVHRAIDVFVERFGGGDLKLFGGEPLLVPDLVRAAITYAPPSVRVYLSTNAVPLDDDLFASPKRIQSLAAECLNSRVPFTWKGTARGSVIGDPR